MEIMGPALAARGEAIKDSVLPDEMAAEEEVVGTVVNQVSLRRKKFRQQPDVTNNIWPSQAKIVTWASCLRFSRYSGPQACQMRLFLQS